MTAGGPGTQRSLPAFVTNGIRGTGSSGEELVRAEIRLELRHAFARFASRAGCGHSAPAGFLPQHETKVAAAMVACLWSGRRHWRIGRRPERYRHVLAGRGAVRRRAVVDDGADISAHGGDLGS